MHWLRALTALATAPAVLADSFQKPLQGSNPIADHSDGPSYRNSLLKLHKDLVGISSTSGREERVGHFLIDYLESKGYKTQKQEVAPVDNTPKDAKRFNVMAWRGDSDHESKARVAISSHIDVVPPHIEYSIDDGPITRDTMIKGRGSNDAKGSVASMIIALEELLAAGKVDDESVMMLFVVGEEIAGDGMLQLSNLLNGMQPPRTFDAVIFGEPTESKLVCGHKGALFCDLIATGVASHSGYPWLGKSANEVTIRALSKILDTDLGSSELYGNTTVNVGLFDGGVAGNVVPERAFVKLGIRVAIGPQETGGDIVKQRIQEILDEVDPHAFEFKCAPGYGSVDCNCDVQGAFCPVTLACMSTNTNRLRYNDGQLRNRRPQLQG